MWVKGYGAEWKDGGVLVNLNMATCIDLSLNGDKSEVRAFIAAGSVGDVCNGIFLGPAEQAKAVFERLTADINRGPSLFCFVVDVQDIIRRNTPNEAAAEV